jgi:hypothetical protein
MKALMALVTALSIPLMILNMLGGVVSGRWLGVLGEWSIIGAGILVFFVSTGLLGFALMPSLLLTAPATYCAENGKTAGLVFFGALSSVYILGLITAWCCGVLYLFVKDASAGSLIPRLLWSYGLATGPWTYMAAKDAQGGESFASMLATFLAQLAYVTIIFLVIFTPVTIVEAVKVFAAFMTVGLVVQMALAVLIQKEIQQSRVLDDSQL